ncbi:MAG: hypothetical protein Q9173_001513 [Seirophora scorigena]
MVKATHEIPGVATGSVSETPERAGREVSSDESETVAEIIAGQRLATGSSDQSSPYSDALIQGSSHATSPVQKDSPKRKASNLAGSLPQKRRFVKKGTAQKVVTPRKTQRHRSSSPSEVASPPRGRDEDVTDSEISEVSKNDDSDGPSYWLMKAEPTSRIGKRKDVMFSIDDFMNASEPEAWIGVRDAAARSNMRSMLEGDMAFFYHWHRNTPGIAGTMQVVREHSVDETAFDPEHPYYDPKSTRERPKWCVVHVQFHARLPQLVKLKEIKKFAIPGRRLENLEMLKMPRLSVSKVTKEEWEFIMSLGEAELV